VNKWLAQAVSDARSAPTRHRHAAILVKDGAVVGQGVARRTRHDPAGSENEWRCSYIHAECAALGAAGGSAKGAVLYVARINASGNPVLSEPCARCRSRAVRAGVSRVVWTE
jgi:deoxycytidylate deaminase